MFGYMDEVILQIRCATPSQTALISAGAAEFYETETMIKTVDGATYYRDGIVVNRYVGCLDTRPQQGVD